MKESQGSGQAEEDVSTAVPEQAAQVQASIPKNKLSTAFGQNSVISAYMAIAASAFGLISDGCTYPRMRPFSVHFNESTQIITT